MDRRRSFSNVGDNLPSDDNETSEFVPCKRIMTTETDNFDEIALQLHDLGCSSYEGTVLETEIDKIPEQLRPAAVRLFDHVNSIMGDVRFQLSAAFETSPLFHAFPEESTNKLTSLLAKKMPFDKWLKYLYQFHSAPRCNVVWRQNTVAYRCQTCGLNSCMSLCAECFDAADHEGHDYSRFFSTVGGCCDCGNPDVMDPKGFCQKHCEDAPRTSKLPKHEKYLLRVVLTRLIIRLLVGMRRWVMIRDNVEGFKNKLNEGRFSGVVHATNGIISKGLQSLFSIIIKLCEGGSEVTDVLIDVLLDENLYIQCCGGLAATPSDDLNRSILGERTPESLDWRTRGNLESDIKSLEDLPAFLLLADKSGIHPIQNNCLLDELVMYQIRTGYPQELIDILLNLLYDTTYKQAFASKFFAYYPYTTAMVSNLLSEMSPGSREGGRVAERIVHISVQICSGAKICLWLQNRIDIVGCALDSTLMMSLAKARPTLLNHQAVRFYSRFPEEFSSASIRSWLSVSVETNPFFERNADLFVLTDLQNLFVHQPIAEHFFSSTRLIEKYVRHISLFQGNCVEWRIPSGDHRLNDWVAIAQRCFNVEFEACSLPMHSLTQHLALLAYTPRGLEFIYNYAIKLVDAIKVWFLAVKLDEAPVDTFLSPYCITFHIPLHRHLASLLFYMQSELKVCREVVKKFAVNTAFLKRVLLHPLRLFAVRAEFYAGMWTRNGQGMRMSVANYTKPTIAFSFISADLILLRFAACYVNQEFFLSSVFHSFHIMDCFAFPSDETELNENNTTLLVLRKTWIPHLFDGVLRLLLDLIVGRRDMEPDSKELLQEEMIALLARQDLPYSHIRVVIPNRGNATYEQNSTEFDASINAVANFVEPDRDNSLQHGKFELKRELYDTHVCPVFCRLRSFGVIDFNEFTVRLEVHDRKVGNIPTHVTPWLGYLLIDFDKDYENRFDTVQPIAGLLTQPSFFAFIARVLSWTKGLESPASLILQQSIYLLSLSCQVLRSEKTFEACKNSLFRQNEYQQSPFYCAEAFTKNVADADDPRAIIAGFFCIDYGCGKELITLILDLFDSAVRKKHSDASEHALYHIVKKLMNPERLQSSRRLHGGCTLYVVRLLNLMTETSSMLASRINTYVEEKFRPIHDVVMTVDTPHPIPGPEGDAKPTIETPAAIAANKKKALVAKREAFLAKLHQKNASRMITHMQKEGITQDEMDRIEPQSSDAAMYECPICGETSDHSVANMIGIFVQTRQNAVVSNAVPTSSYVSDLMDLESVGGNNRRSLLPKPFLNRRIFGEKRDNCFIADFQQRNDIAMLREIRFRTGIEVRTCRHFAHMSCFQSYLDSIVQTNRVFRVDFTIACPMCRSPINGILPLKMEFGRDRVRADFDINNIQQNYKQILRFYVSKLNDPRPIADPDSPIRAQVTAYRETVEAFEDLPYRQLLNTISGPSTWVNPEGRFKGFDARMSFVQSIVERLVMTATVDLPMPPFSKGSVIEHIIGGAITLLLSAEQKVIFRNFESLLGFAANDDRALSAGPALLAFDFQSLFLRCVALPLVDERFVLGDREEFFKLIYRIITPLIFTRAIYNGVVSGETQELYDEFLMTTNFGSETIVTRALQVILMENRDYIVGAKDQLFLDPKGKLLCGGFRERPLRRCKNLADMKAIAIDDATSMFLNLTKFAIMLKKEVFKTDMTPEEVAIVRGNDLSLLYKLIIGEDANPDSEGRNFHSIAKAGEYYIYNLTNAFDSLQHLPLILMNDIYDWKYRSILNLPPLYDKLFATFFGRRCENCYTIPKHQMLCLLCGSLMCLTRCTKSNEAAPNADADTYIEQHTVNCGGGCCVYLSLNSTMVVINYYRLAVLWGTVYLDAHGEEDRNLGRGKPLFLSKNRMNQLQHGWYVQDLDRRAHLRWISLEQLSTALKQCHHGH